eukprot:TRINITY_DN32780_c0_g1_i1.p1 TRINITY_DN32780_c0_g1~~TRINITY_DN32780_c0_g1_i1.p1  ORF type:complete len:625 (+),score=207.04 TRINITY_DN32780_c0_g1_i1:57-1877(+)
MADEQRFPYRRYFLQLLAIRIVAAAGLPIADCDETYNYWEPTHWLLYGSGFQTWEWSPAFALRSWLYVGLHAAMGAPAVAVGVSRPVVFFIVRGMIAALGCAADTAFAAAAGSAFGGKVGELTWHFLAFGAGTTAAGIAYLPSSAAMQMLTYAAAAQMSFDESKHQYLWQGVLFSVAAVVLGWPFVGLLCIPLGLAAVRWYGLYSTAVAVLCATSVLSALVAAADTVCYGRAVFSTWELVKYNVLGCLPVLEARKIPLDQRSGLLSKIGCVKDPDGLRGSHLYGVESWDFFFRNLLLNFNVAFPLALVAPIALVVQRVVLAKRTGLFRRLWQCLPFHLWFGFWLFIPHKEERFMAPAYAFLCLSAAMSLDAASDVAERIFAAVLPRSRRGTSAMLSGWFTGAVLLLYACAGISRSMATVQHYGAPLRIMRQFAERAHDFEEKIHLESRTLAPPTELVLCLGKEWYRYHSSFLAPPVDYGALPVRVRFIKSSFGGLLPKPFGPKGSRGAPQGFNDLNQPDPQQFTDIDECHYLMDSEMEGQTEERYAKDSEAWAVVAEEPFLDAARTPLVTRAFLLPGNKDAVHGRYMLLRRRDALSPAQRARIKKK